MSSQRKRLSQTSQTICVCAITAKAGVQGEAIAMPSPWIALLSITYSPDTVQCDRCKRYFHMRCVQPPLLAKPTRGYGWTCAPCSRRHEEEVDSHDVRPTAPAGPKAHKSNAPPVRGRGRPRKDKSLAEKEENFPVKHFKLWPFRYFG